MLLSELHSDFIPNDRFIPHLDEVIGGNNVKKYDDPHYPEKLGHNTDDPDELPYRSGNQYATPKTYDLHKRGTAGRQDIEGVASRRPVKVKSKDFEPENVSVQDQLEPDYDEEDLQDRLERLFKDKLPRRQTYHVPPDFSN